MILIISLTLALFWALIATGIAWLCHTSILPVALAVFLFAFCGCVLGLSLCAAAGQNQKGAFMNSLAELRDNYTASQELLAIREEQIGELLNEKAQLRATLDEAREIIKCHYTKAAATWLKKYKETP